MKKLGKTLLGLLAAGAALGTAAILARKKSEEASEVSPEASDEEYAGEGEPSEDTASRNYVHLNCSPAPEQDVSEQGNSEQEEAPEQEEPVPDDSQVCTPEDIEDLEALDGAPEEPEASGGARS